MQKPQVPTPTDTALETHKQKEIEMSDKELGKVTGGTSSRDARRKAAPT